MRITLMADRFGYQSAVDELKEEWLEDLLVYMGVDVHEIHEQNEPAFVEFLMENQVDIVSYPNIGALSVEQDGELIGEWAGPELTLKQDPETGELYYEIEIEYWSIMEEDIDLSS